MAKKSNSNHAPTPFVPTINGLHRVKSEAVAALGYSLDEETGDGVLLVVFTSGRLYVYEGVTAATYAALLNAPSKGAFLNKEVVHSHKAREAEGLVTIAVALPGGR